MVSANGQEIQTDNVVVASGAYQNPFVPAFAADLEQSIVQLHSSQYRRPSQLRDGPVLVVGAGNSGAEIALDVVGEHRTILAGRDPGEIPVDLDGRLGAVLDPLIWFALNDVLSIDNPIGRRGRSTRLHGVPVERARPARLRAAGVERSSARAVGVREGLPQLDDGQVVDAANVIWCTGYRRNYAWIDLPIVGDDGWPLEDHGVVASVPGLYFVGLPFQRAVTSSLLGGVGRDAAAVVDNLAARATATVGRVDVVDRGRETATGFEHA